MTADRVAVPKLGYPVLCRSGDPQPRNRPPVTGTAQRTPHSATEDRGPVVGNTESDLPPL